MSVSFTAVHTTTGLRIPGTAEVNVNGSNFAALAERLDLPVSEYGDGDLPAEELLGRCLVANVGRDDSGVAGTQTSDTWFEGGVRPGYFDQRIGELADLCVAAGEHVVQWM